MKITGLCDEILELDKKATKGPWDSYFETGIRPMVVTFTEKPNGFRELVKGVLFLGEKGGLADTEFVAHSRENYPKLARALKVYIQETQRLLNKVNVVTALHRNPYTAVDHVSLDELNNRQIEVEKALSQIESMVTDEIE